MISYTIFCDKDHEFSDRFEDLDDLQTKLKAKALKCPVCGSTHLTKGLSTPNVGGQVKPELPACPAAGGCMNGACGLKG